ncbi:hypothetical protein QIH87_50190 (plasmid) [Bradyrhizobium elkanii]|uniref:hypothetical protein n=1 Tax=Bradyrhizobium elkanii TaxID=29448 RepID=UPI0027153D70|nr:hypothetical protein [Bradyrhizobium elkanii]WLB14803.1 hypothetical protein QIH87_50190 [Bradyrhizobium elkanii]WLB69106.1 hypothetical protein QIH89_27725 [Bradyrhizobium elkanii]
MSGRIPKDKRDAIARISVGVMKKFGRKDAVELIKASCQVSDTTAQHIIRRGIFLSVNQGTK